MLSLKKDISVINIFNFWQSKLFTHENWISCVGSIYDIPNYYQIYSDTEMPCFHEYEQRCDENVRKHVFSSQIFFFFVISDKTKQKEY